MAVWSGDDTPVRDHGIAPQPYFEAGELMAKARVKQAWEIQLEHDTATLVALGYDTELSHAVLSDGGEYLIPFIKKYLRTEEQKQWLADNDISIEDALNGRIEGGTPPEMVAMFEDWKKKTAGLLF